MSKTSFYRITDELRLEVVASELEKGSPEGGFWNSYRALITGLGEWMYLWGPEISEYSLKFIIKSSGYLNRQAPEVIKMLLKKGLIEKIV